MATWIKHIQKPFEEVKDNIPCNQECNKGPPITVSKVRNLSKSIKDSKTAGPDIFRSEFSIK